MSTTIDIHQVTHVYVLDEVKSSGSSYAASRRTIMILTRDGRHNLGMTVYGDGPVVPVFIGDCPDE
jgi:hypothetical protein